ncbi:hypothetical protein PCANB_002320 [Pneumocystis canis]|nr:hypothetical protein PCK1_002427 [Pneumocystis canis]KAG5438990.1 hypothetical protein PCANB_002320 [Pneumocystis canis]
MSQKGYCERIQSMSFDTPFLNKRIFKTQEQDIRPIWSSFHDISTKFPNETRFSENKDEMPRLLRSSTVLIPGKNTTSDTSHFSPYVSIKYKRERAETMPSELFGKKEFCYSSLTMNTNPLQLHDHKMGFKSSFIPNTPSPTTLRIRSGSLTLHDRNMYASAFDPFIFSSNWTQCLNSQNILSSTYSLSSKDEGQGQAGEHNYLGLVDISESLRLSESSFISCNSASEGQENKMYMSGINSLKKDSNRIRSYSVSAKEKYEKGDNSSINTNKEDIYFKDRNYSESFDILYQDCSNSFLRPRARTTDVIDFSLNRMDKQVLPSQTCINESSVLKNNSLNTIVSASCDNANLNEMEYGIVMSQPTRSLWIINLPLAASNSSLTDLFFQFGVTESIWILANKNYGFVNYTALESAIQAKASLNGKELFSGDEPIRVEYIKPLKNPMNMCIFNIYPFNAKTDELKSKFTSLSAFSEKQDDLKSVVMEIALNYTATQEEADKIWIDIQNIGKLRNYAHDIPPIPELSLKRQFCGLRLKEIRKKFDSGGYTQKRVDEIANDMIDEISELSSDYLGNTIVQKLFEYCSEETKGRLLKEIAPHLSGLGIHKNGTWAAQKIIDLAKTEAQINDIIEHLSPYIPLLFLDQFGNYVVQRCLRFEAPVNNFIIESMADRCWEISQGHFGARAMRACLESSYVTKEQQRYFAVVITLESYRLATNPNSIILLTWLLNSPFPNRYKMLALQFVHHIVYLCTHKLASSIILRIINQKSDIDAREILLNTLFFSRNGQILNEVLSEEYYGVNTIFKIFTVAYLEEELRQRISIALKQAFSQLKVIPGQQHKSLMNEIGLNYNLRSVLKKVDLRKTCHVKIDDDQKHTLTHSEFKNNEVQEPKLLFSPSFSLDYYRGLHTINNIYPLQGYPISRQKMDFRYYDMPFIHQQSKMSYSFPYINPFFNQQYMLNEYSYSLPLYSVNVNTHRN